MPFLGNLLNKVMDEKTVGDVYIDRRKAYKDLLNLDKGEKLLQEDKESLENLLKSDFLSEEEKKFIAKDF
jgi:hypothetical protein